MLEGSFRPPSSAAAVDGPPTSAPPSSSSVATRPGPPYHSLPSYSSQSARSPGTPPEHSPSATSTTYVAPWPAYSSSHRTYDPVRHHSPSAADLAPPPRSTVPPRDQDVQREKDGKAKKKPAGSACNSCHRLKTRCSGGSPCERCASHNVACEFDRSLIYRSPLASSSQQATAKNASQLNGHPNDADDASAQASAKSKKRPRSSTAAMTQPSPQAPSPPVHPSAHQSHPSQSSANGSALPKVLNSPVSMPKSNHRSSSSPIDDRLAILEQNVGSIMGALGLANSYTDTAPPITKDDESWLMRKRIKFMPGLPNLPTPSGNPLLAAPERDDEGVVTSDSRLPEDDPVTAGIVTEAEAVLLFDIFVDRCLPYLPMLHSVSYGSIRSRSQLLFTTMLAIAAAFSSSQAVSVSKATTRDWVKPHVVDRLATLAYRNLAGTLIAPAHSADDVCATLFLASWRLRPEGQAPARSVLVGHATRMAAVAGFGQRARVVGEKGSKIWRNRLDEYRTAMCGIVLDTVFGLHSDSKLLDDCSQQGSTLVDLANGSPFHYDVTSCAVFQAQAELSSLSQHSRAFVASASQATDRESASFDESSVLAASRRYNDALDAWGSRWIYSGSAWAPLLGSQLRTLRLLADDYRITLNLAVSHILLCLNPPNKSPSYLDGLNSALDRINTASAAVIQSHKDAMREGASLAFCPDIVTEGLVSAAMTMIQLASKPVDGPPTPTSHDSNMMTTMPLLHPPSPMSPISFLFRSVPSAQQVLEPAVASHFIKMATEVMSGGDRSETLRGSYATTIYRLASQLGLKDFEHFTNGHATHTNGHGGGPFSTPTVAAASTATTSIAKKFTAHGRNGRPLVKPSRRSRSLSSGPAEVTVGQGGEGYHGASHSPAGSM